MRRGFGQLRKIQWRRGSRKRLLWAWGLAEFEQVVSGSAMQVLWQINGKVGSFRRWRKLIPLAGRIVGKVRREKRSEKSQRQNEGENILN